MDGKKLQIAAYGHGVRGLNNYGFNLDLHSSINTEVMFLRLSLHNCTNI